MKAIYNKPELCEVLLSANQAIAACAVPVALKMSYLNSKCIWCGGSESNNFDSTKHKHAREVHNTDTCDFTDNYLVEQIDGDGWFYFEDTNQNGKLDNFDNWQDVHGFSNVTAIINS